MYCSSYYFLLAVCLVKASVIKLVDSLEINSLKFLICLSRHRDSENNPLWIDCWDKAVPSNVQWAFEIFPTFHNHFSHLNFRVWLHDEKGGWMSSWGAEQRPEGSAEIHPSTSSKVKSLCVAQTEGLVWQASASGSPFSLLWAYDCLREATEVLKLGESLP